jgi:hypothetical protein
MWKTMKAILQVYWNFLFYPLLFGLFIWLWIKGVHWIWGAMVVAAMLIFDPLWRAIFRR